MFNVEFEKLTAKERGKILQDRRKSLGLSQSDLAREILMHIKDNYEDIQSELADLAYEVLSDTKKISEWETGRIKSVPADYLDVWKIVLGMERCGSFEKIKLPVITREDFDSPYVQRAVEFLKYVLVMKKENGLSEYEISASRHGMRDLMEDFFAVDKIK